MVRSRYFILGIAGSIGLFAAALFVAAPPDVGRALGSPLALNGGSLFEHLDGSKLSTKTYYREAEFKISDRSFENMKLCPAVAEQPELSTLCSSPVVPERAVSLRFIMPGGREHKSSPSSGSIALHRMPGDQKSDRRLVAMVGATDARSLGMTLPRLLL